MLLACRSLRIGVINTHALAAMRTDPLRIERSRADLRCGAVHENTALDDVADRLIGAIEAGDVDAVRALYTDDAVIWHNFDRLEQTADQNLAVLTWMTQQLSDLRYEDITRQRFDGGFVQQHSLRGTTKSGAALDVPCCLIVHVEDGHITRIDEYLDTAHLQPLLG